MWEKLADLPGAEDGKTTMRLYVKNRNHEYIHYLFGYCAFSSVITETTNWFQFKWTV